MVKRNFRQRIEAVLRAVEQCGDNLPPGYYMRQFNAHVAAQCAARAAADPPLPPPGCFPRGFFPQKLMKTLVHWSRRRGASPNEAVDTSDLRVFFTNLDVDEQGALVMRRAWPWHPSADGSGVPALFARGRGGRRFYLRANTDGAPAYGLNGEVYVRTAALAATARNFAAWMLQFEMFDTAAYKAGANANTSGSANASAAAAIPATTTMSRPPEGGGDSAGGSGGGGGDSGGGGGKGCSAAFKTVESLLAHQLVDFARHSQLLPGRKWTPLCTHTRPVVLQGRTKSTGTLLHQPVVLLGPDTNGLTLVADGSAEGPQHLLPTATLMPVPAAQAGVRGFLQVEVGCAGTYGVDVHVATDAVRSMRLKEQLVLLPRARRQQLEHLHRAQKLLPSSSAPSSSSSSSSGGGRGSRGRGGAYDDDDNDEYHDGRGDDDDKNAGARKRARRSRTKKERRADPYKAGTGQRRVVDVERARAQVRRDIHNHRMMGVAERHRHEKVVTVLDQMLSSKRFVPAPRTTSAAAAAATPATATAAAEAAGVGAAAGATQVWATPMPVGGEPSQGGAGGEGGVGGGGAVDDSLTEPAVAAAVEAGGGGGDGGAAAGAAAAATGGDAGGEWWTKSVHWAVTELLKQPTFKANSSRLVGLVRRALDTGHVEPPRR